MTLKLAAKLICKGTNVASLTIDDYNALTYILLMDASYQIYYKHLRTLPLTQKYKQLRNDIGTKWKDWTKWLYLGLNTDEIADIGDAMDVFHEYIGKVEQQLCYSVLNVAGKLPEKYRSLITYTQIALLLAQSAEGQFSYIYKRSTELSLITNEEEHVLPNGKKYKTALMHTMKGTKPQPSPEALLAYIGALARLLNYIADNAEKEKVYCSFNDDTGINITVKSFIKKITTMPYGMLIEEYDKLLTA